MHRELEKDALELAGIEVTVAETAFEGFRLLENRKFDAIVLDLGLPNISGIQALKKIRASKRYGDISVVVCTASGHKKDVAECANWHIDDYIVKPFKIKSFISKVKGAAKKYEPEKPKKEKPDNKISVDDYKRIREVQVAMLVREATDNSTPAERILDNQFADELDSVLAGNEGHNSNKAISLEKVTPGMELLSDIKKNNLVILKSGMRLTESNIQKLKEMEIETIKVKPA